VKIYRLILMVFVALIFVHVVCAAETMDRIVAQTTDDVITQSELNRAFAPYAASIEKSFKGAELEEALRQNKQVFLQNMIDQMLIEREIKKAQPGIGQVSEEEIMSIINDMLNRNNISIEDYQARLAQEGIPMESVKKDIRLQVLRMRLLRREVQSRILVTDEEIGHYYNEHREDYEGKEAVRVKQIFLPAPAHGDEKTRQNARQLADELLARIRNGAPFEVIAAQYSRAPGAQQGGDIGFIERGIILPALEKVAFSLENGQTSEVIETEVGMHLISVVDRRGAGLKPLTDVRNEIRAKIEEEKVAKKYDEWIEEIRKKSFIDVRL